jgi:hypothetical protein
MFWCMFVPESRSFHCTALQSRSMMYVLYIKEICRFLHESAAHCKMRKIRLKIRRPSRPWGFDPPSRHHLSLYYLLFIVLFRRTILFF